uniref:Uncharacterized protein n=1 Tax=Vespula pensylvanica TaxID=30213 RepID=A0A834U997_VESPE|nr:hypothetical protein H0235_008558 [Vespula pensylvanica]
MGLDATRRNEMASNKSNRKIVDKMGYVEEVEEREHEIARELDTAGGIALEIRLPDSESFKPVKERKKQ